MQLARLFVIVALFGFVAVSASADFGDIAAFPEHEPIAAQENQDIAFAQVAATVEGQQKGGDREVGCACVPPSSTRSDELFLPLLRCCPHCTPPHWRSSLIFNITQHIELTQIEIDTMTSTSTATMTCDRPVITRCDLR